MTALRAVTIYGSERRESAEERAKRIVAEGLKLLGWDEASLRERLKGDHAKVLLARQLAWLDHARWRIHHAQRHGYQRADTFLSRASSAAVIALASNMTRCGTLFVNIGISSAR